MQQLRLYIWCLCSWNHYCHKSFQHKGKDTNIFCLYVLIPIHLPLNQHLQVTQYNCNYINKAPVGCDQWHFTDSGAGYIYSFGNDGSTRHFANQHQTTCIRQGKSCLVEFCLFKHSFSFTGGKLETVVSAIQQILSMISKSPSTLIKPALLLLAPFVVDMVPLALRSTIWELMIV